MATYYGTLSPTWGTEGDSNYNIIIETIEQDTPAESADLTDGDGTLVGFELFGKKTEISCDFKITDSNFPSDADVEGQVTLTGNFAGTYACTNVKLSRQKGDFKGGSMTLRNIPSATTTTTTTT